MAGESRWRRRLLSDTFQELLQITKPEIRATRVVVADSFEEPYYIFLLLPHYPAWNRDQYRRIRSKMLTDYCVLVRQQFSAARSVVGVAAEAGDADLNSLDISYFDATNWTPALEIEAERLKRFNGAFTAPTTTTWIDKEFPSITPPKHRLSRNSKCFCGNGKRYKHCHGKGVFRKERLGLFEK